MLRGRRRELERAATALAGTTSGRGAAAVVVDGDAGMGKSALLDAVLAGAGAGTGAAVLRGRGHALGSGLAYGPVAGAISRHLHGTAETERQDLVAGLGSLGLLVEGIGDPPPAGDPELDRARMFQAVGLLLSRMAAAAPVVLGIDDLHWADTASIELLEHLVAELRTEAVAFVVAARPGGLAERPDTRHLVAELLRLPGAVRLTVGPLDEVTVAEVVTDRVGGAVAPAFVTELVDRTGGVVLAVDAVLGALLADDALREGAAGWEPTVPLVVPGYVVDLFGQRLEGLDGGARAVVEAVAVADGALPEATAAAVLGVAATDLARAAAEAGRAGLLVEGAPGTWDASHPLVATAALDRIPDPARRALHAAFVDLDAGGGDLDEVARHVEAAGPAVDDDRATGLLARAGRRAAHRGAADVAGRWLTAAADRAAGAGAPPGDVAALLTEAADAAERRGDLAGAKAHRARVAGLLGAHDPAGAAAAAAATAALAWQLGHGDTDAWWAEALERAAVAGPVALLATRHGQLGARLRSGRTAEAREVAEQVRHDLASLGPDVDERDAAAVATAWNRLLMFDCFAGGRPAEEILEQLRELPADTPLASFVETEGVRLDALLLLGRFDEARRAGASLLRRLGPDAGVTSLSWRPVAARVHTLLVAGAFDDAEDVLGELVSGSPVVRSAQAFWLGVLALRRGDTDRARALVADVRPTVDATSLAMRHRYLDAIDGYADVVDGRVPTVQLDEQPEEYFAMAHALRSSLVGEILVAQGRRADAREVATWMRRRGRPGSHPHAVADRIDALATDDAAGLAAAATALERFGAPFDAAVARVEAAERDRSAVGPHDLARAGDLLDRVGAAPWSARLAALGPTPPRHRGPAIPELTRREREVAELVAEGLTNGQVAERLGVSIRTVTSHLDHAYTKLGIGSRAALVAHVLRLPAPT